VTTATLDGHRATSMRVTLPSYGLGWVEATLDEEVTLAGACTVVLADLTLACTIMSGGPHKGRSRYRLALGGGGWGATIAAKGYADDAGVKRAKVLADAAAAAGETFVDSETAATATRLGPSYARVEGPASRVLHETAPGAWYVDETGTTRLGARAAAAIGVSFTAGPLDTAMGCQTIAATSIATLLPGVTVDGNVATDVVHSVDAEQGLRTTLHYAGVTNGARRLELWRELFDALDPHRRFRGVTEYRVVTLEGERLNLQPVLVSGGMPDLRRVVARPGVAGCKAEVALGSRVGVAFMNSDPSRPYVACYEDAEGEGWRADVITIEADGVAIGDAGGRTIRHGEIVAISGVFTLGTGTTMATITLHPSMVAPGNPGTGFSRVMT
jgi:hypothetical protein